MGTTLLGGAAALMLLLFWTLRRRPAALLRSTDASGVAALNRAQIARLQGDAPVHSAAAASTAQLPEATSPAPGRRLPADCRRPRRLAEWLLRQLSGSGQQRLEAMRAARHWGHPAALPVLRRGLRDVDPAVVLEAARGIERFRRSPRRAVPTDSAQIPLPRNVSRMR